MFMAETSSNNTGKQQNNINKFYKHYATEIKERIECKVNLRIENR